MNSLSVMNRLSEALANTLTRSSHFSDVNFICISTLTLLIMQIIGAKWFDDQALEREDVSLRLAQDAFFFFQTENYFFLLFFCLHLSKVVTFNFQTNAILHCSWHFIFTGWLTGAFD